jgi:hypothetical protein
LTDKEIEEGGEGATLPHACQELVGLGRDPVDSNRGPGIMQEDAGPVDHACATAHCGHDVEQEVAVHGVKGLGDVDEYDGSCGVEGDHDSRKEGGEGNVVMDEAVGQVG